MKIRAEKDTNERSLQRGTKQKGKAFFCLFVYLRYVILGLQSVNLVTVIKMDLKLLQMV